MREKDVNCPIQGDWRSGLSCGASQGAVAQRMGNCPINGSKWDSLIGASSSTNSTMLKSGVGCGRVAVSAGYPLFDTLLVCDVVLVALQRPASDLGKDRPGENVVLRARRESICLRS